MYVADVGILSARHLDLALHKVSDLKGGGHQFPALRIFKLDLQQ